jgi:hypothetical protein
MRKSSPTGLLKLAALVAFLYLIEIGLILLGVIPAFLTYSPGNLVFSLATIAIVIYAGITFAKLGLGRAAFSGAVLSSIGAFLVSVATVVSVLYIHVAVLGVHVENDAQLLVSLFSMVFLYALIGAIVAVLAAVIKDRIGH